MDHNRHAFSPPVDYDAVAAEIATESMGDGGAPEDDSAD